jgi:hypothetical protein
VRITTETQARNAPQGRHSIGGKHAAQGFGFKKDSSAIGAGGYLVRYALGKERWTISLGTFNEISLEAASKAAREAVALAAKGIDPRAAREREKAANLAAVTFEQATKAHLLHLIEMGFVVHHAPTSANPHLPVEEIAALRATMRPEEAAQELDALFVDMAGVSIFPLAALLENGQPVADDRPLDTIGVAIDSAAGETGFEHDGTAAVIYGLRQPRIAGDAFAMTILDWDVRSLALGAAGAWLKHVNDLYRQWVVRLHPRLGLDGFHIEKPAMGLRLLELAADQRIPATALPTDWVELGKDGRALMAAPHILGGRVKLAKTAYDKRMEFKGAVHNHLVAQLTGFRLFDRKASKRADDLSDAAIYAVLRCLGDGRAGRWDRLKRVA